LVLIGHSLKNVGPSQKNLHHPWCPKLVTGLIITAAQQQHKFMMKDRKGIS